MSGRTTGLPTVERDALRERLVAHIPPRYSPAFHLLFPSTVGLGNIVGCALFLRDFQPWQLAVIPLSFVLLNASEWRIHRDLLHHRMKPLQFLYDRHTPEHHMVFITDDMAVRSAREWRLVLIPPYGILAAAAGILPIPFLLGLVGQWNLGVLFLATAMAYVVSYEWLHLAYHLAPDSFVGRRSVIGWLRRHHATHHDPRLMQKWNFNVTVPLWDLVRGTIYRRDVARDRAPDRSSSPAHR